MNLDTTSNSSPQTTCIETLCQTEYNDVDQYRTVQKLIHEGYGYRMYLDDLPSATVYDNQTHYEENIPIGYIERSSGDQEDKYWLYNHLDIKVLVSGIETLSTEKPIPNDKRTKNPEESQAFDSMEVVIATNDG